VTPEERADRITGLLDRLALGVEPLPHRLDIVLDHLGADKKHAGGRLRWILPTGDGVVVRDDIPSELVATAAARLLTSEVPA
jgi:3-dehydroquinate synthetase